MTDILPFFCAPVLRHRPRFDGCFEALFAAGLFRLEEEVEAEPSYSSRPCLLRLQTIPVCSFELKPSFS